MDHTYICASAKAPDGGIYHYIQDASGALAQHSFAPLDNCTFLASSADGKVFYATCITHEGGSVASFDVQKDGSLLFAGTCASDGMTACYIACSPDGKFIYAANYRAGSICEFSVDQAGHALTRTRTIRHNDEERGPNSARQEQAHPHCTVFTPDGKYLAAVDLGIDQVLFYRYIPGRGIEAEPCGKWHAAPGDGPRHILFAPDGEMVYLINELGNSVVSMRYQDGTFEEIERQTTLPEDFTGATKAAAIRFSPDFRYLFATNRGYDSVACYALDGRGGMKRYALIDSGAKSPRDANFLPNRQFATANEEGFVVFFDYDEASGMLKANGRRIALACPLYIL